MIGHMHWIGVLEIGKRKYSSSCVVILVLLTLYGDKSHFKLINPIYKINTTENSQSSHKGCFTERLVLGS